MLTMEGKPVSKYFTEINTVTFHNIWNSYYSYSYFIDQKILTLQYCDL